MGKDIGGMVWTKAPVAATVRVDVPAVIRKRLELAVIEVGHLPKVAGMLDQAKAEGLSRVARADLALDLYVAAGDASYLRGVADGAGLASLLPAEDVRTAATALLSDAAAQEVA